ncbi:collagen alpha-3(VI) chain-like [Porites lutea]|uniref:collagen alpha-3(VI) chain-like n=1 Tax=Porites lutea TaxID=51062 RepID=UPI003CC6AB8A
MDLAFLLDSSSSVGRIDYQKQIDFVGLVSRMIDVSYFGSHIGVISYSSQARLDIPFSESNNSHDLLFIMKDLKFLGGSARIGHALDLAFNELFTVSSGSRLGVPKVVVVFSYGHEPNTTDFESLSTSVEPYKAEGISVIAVGIGPNAGLQRLRVLVENDKLVLAAYSFKELSDLAVPITSLACRVAEPKKVIHPMDVLFLIDTSEGVSDLDFQREKNFIKTVVRSFKISSDHSRVGLMSYSNKTEITVNFSDEQSHDSLLERVESLPFLGGQRQFNNALETAAAQFFSPSGSSRSVVQKAAVIITNCDQVSTKGTDHLEESSLLQENDVKVLIIAVGCDGADQENNLQKLVQDGEQIFTPDSFENLAAAAKRLTVVAADIAAPDECTKSADVAFILDSSDSVGMEDYQLQKDFVKAIAESFGIRPTGSRVGVIIASKDAAVNIKLSDHLHVEDLKESVDKLPYIGGTARIDKALNLATSKLFVSQGGARPGLSKILIIVTTGKQNATRNGELIGVVAQKLLRMGVTVYVIVVGKEVDDKVLGSLVTEEENLFLEDSFKSLMLKTRQLAKMACDNAGFSRCINPVDVAFLVDSSGSLEEEGFNKQKEFIKAVAATLDISPFHSQIGVITYSDRASVEIKLSDHQHQEDLINAVESMKYIGRTTRIDKAVAIATKELMTPGAGRREDIPGVLVILTDGRQTPDSDTTPLNESSSSLEKLGVKTIVVGIGELADEKGLQKLARRNKDVFHAPSVELLPNVAQSVATSICEEAAPQSCDVSLDVAILVESSANVPPNEFQNMKDFIKDIVKYLLAFEGEQQVSIILYGSQATTRVAFGQYHSEFDFKKIIDSLPLQKGLARLDNALQFVFSQVFTAKGGVRPGVQKVCIVLTNEQRPGKKYSDDVKTAVEPLHQAGVRVIAIGVTSLADWRQLRVLTRDPKDVIRSRSCDSLVAKVSHLFRRTCYKAAYRQCDGIGDVIFAVHSPDSLSPLNYRKEKEFVKRVATTLNIAPGKSRVGLILYSNFATVSAELGDKSTLELFNNLVDGLPQKSGKTRIDRALKLAFSLFHTTGAIRRAVPKILILLASEKQTLVPEVSNLKDAAHPLHKANIRILAVGMGQGFEETDLRTVTRTAKDVFLAPAFEDLFSLSGSISKITCEAAKPPICSEPIDVAFLVDSSGSIGAADFEMQKAFIKAVAGTLAIEKGIAHAGSVVYSDIATVQQSFDQCNGTKSVMQAIDRLPYYGRTTRIDRALSLANTAMFSAAGGCRSHAAKALLLLTDGTQTPALDSIALEQVVKPLKGKKVARLALGIGKKVSASELRRVVDKDDDVMTVDSFDDLLSSLHLVSKKICSSAKIKKCPTPVDIAFLLDSSGSIGERSYETMKDFVKKVADAFVIGPSTTCAGVIIFGSSATTAVRFADATNNTVFNAAVDALPYMRGETRIDKALQLASAELLNHPSGARVGVAKVVIVLTDGGQSNAPYAMDIQKAVAPLLSAGIRIFAVGIGKDVDDRQLRLMVDNKDDAIMVPSFDGLSVRARQLSIAACESSEIDPCDNTMDVAFLLDSSGSLTPTQFQQSKDFIDLLAASFLKSKVGSRVGLIQFSIVPKIKVWFSDQLTHERFQSVLRKVRYKGGYTRLDRALMLADEKLFTGKEGVRKHIPKIMIVLSDGVNTDTPDAVAFDAAVAPLHRAGVRVFVVATGNEEGRNNLYLLTQRKKDLYRTETYDDLALQLRKISRDTCESGALPRCEQVMDVSFIIDSSESVGLKNYQKLLDLVRNIAKSLEISPTGSHASVVIFSDTVRVQIKLDDHEEILEFNKALRDVPYLGRKTRIDKALRVATVGVFNRRSGMRAGVRRVAVILTEGHQTRTFDSIPLRYAVEPLRRKRVKVFAVGVGNDVRYDELRSLTDSDQNVLMVKTFQGLFSVAEELSNKMCRG